MAESKQPILKRPAKPEPVDIELPDGKMRQLQYTVGSLRRIKAALGKSMIGGISLDEDLATLIYHGLYSATGEPPEGITVEDIDSLPAPWVPYLLQRFTLAYNGSLPEKKLVEMPSPENPPVESLQS